MPVGKTHQHRSWRGQDMRSSPSWPNLRPPLRGDSPRQWTPGTVIKGSHIWQGKRKKLPLSLRHRGFFTKGKNSNWLTESTQLDQLLQPSTPKLCFYWPSPSPPTSLSCGHYVCRPCWVQVQQRKNKFEMPLVQQLSAQYPQQSQRGKSLGTMTTGLGLVYFLCLGFFWKGGEKRGGKSCLL